MIICKKKSNIFTFPAYYFLSVKDNWTFKRTVKSKKKLQCMRTNLTTNMNVGLNFFIPTTEECKLVAYAEEEASGDQIWRALTHGFGSFPIWKLGFFFGVNLGFYNVEQKYSKARYCFTSMKSWRIKGKETN